MIFRHVLRRMGWRRSTALGAADRAARRYRGESGHRLDIVKVTRLTRAVWKPDRCYGSFAESAGEAMHWRRKSVFTQPGPQSGLRIPASKYTRTRDEQSNIDL